MKKVIKKQKAKAIAIQTIPCPIHGNPLELKEQDGKLIAVCNCDVKNNKYAGNPVYERSIDKE
jgi:hypothetical protein